MDWVHLSIFLQVLLFFLIIKKQKIQEGINFCEFDEMDFSTYRPELYENEVYISIYHYL
jgi:hypothetical protein